jgi:hypothetical protein
MARTINGGTDRLVCTVGAAPQTTGGFSCAAIIRTPATITGYRGIVEVGGATGNDWYFGVGDGPASIFLSANALVETGSVLSVSDWCMIGVDKAAGTTSPRFHLYRYANNTFTHTTPAGTTADNGALTSPDVNIGHRRGSAVWNGDIHIAAAWDRRLSDAEWELLPFSYSYWIAANPKVGVMLDQSDVAQKLLDWTGNGANESSRTGTTVSINSVPVFSYGAPLPFVEIQPAAVGGGAAGPRDLLLLGAG